MQLWFVGPERAAQLCSPLSKIKVAKKALILEENITSNSLI